MFTYREVSDDHREVLIEELKAQYEYKPVAKDILIVVHNQHDHIYNCLESIKKNTSNYNLLIWDNACDEKTRCLFNSTFRSKMNMGFIEPNNKLAEKSTSPYIILLNSDTIVSPGWDEAMIGILQKDPSLGAVGFCGGKLDKRFFGTEGYYGKEIDYVTGWCLCFSRDVYNKFGLFDENLTFAYGEDSDFCVKLKTNGYGLYALHLNYVKHVGNATIKNIKENRNQSFIKNHLYLQEKWGKYLA